MLANNEDLFLVKMRLLPFYMLFRREFVDCASVPSFGNDGVASFPLMAMLHVEQVVHGMNGKCRGQQAVA